VRAITLDLPIPAELWFRLESAANLRGCTVEEFAARIITREVAIEHLVGGDTDALVADFIAGFQAQAGTGPDPECE